MAGLKEEAEKVKNLGFTGKAAIHPDQIDHINEAFSPSAEEKDCLLYTSPSPRD